MKEENDPPGYRITIQRIYADLLYIKTIKQGG
jgi:hypothetical protein